MFNGLLKSLYENQVLILYELLKSLGAKVTIATIDDILHEHPDYPSFLSISDSLEKWNIESVSIETSKEKLNEIPTPFITAFKQNVFILVTKVHENSVAIKNQHGKHVIMTKADFFDKWTEQILLAELNERSGEADYQKKYNLQALRTAVFALIPTVILAAIWLPVINATSPALTAAYLSAKVVGLATTILLLWYDIDKGNPLLKHICSGIQKANCNAVLNTKAASLFGLVSWGEVGFFYFMGGLLFLVFGGIQEAMPVVTALSLFASPYVFFSIYYQWKVAKQWCTLCLLVQAVLIAETVFVFISGIPTIGLALGTLSGNLVSILIAFTLPVFGWYLVKPLLKKLQKAKYEKRAYLRLKFNEEFFWGLLSKQKSIKNYPTEGLGITIGNPKARHTIVKVCNPYCGPCASAHPELEKIIAKNPNINARIIFSVTANENDFRAKPVKHLLAIAE
jgi:uncharacterized membrane protein